MPMRPKRPCRYPGCKNLSDGSYCEEHRKKVESVLEKRRGNARERGYTTAWDKARSVYLRDHPLCEECLRNGRITPATVVDHIIPHRGDRKLFWDQTNWQVMCKACHDHKTGTGL